MRKSSKPNSHSAPLRVSPKFHPKLGVRADPTHTHALLVLDTAHVAELSLSAPQQGYGKPQDESAHRSGRPRSSTPTTLLSLSRAARSALRAPPAKALLRSTHECSP